MNERNVLIVSIAVKLPKPPPFETMSDGRQICADTPDGAREYRRRTLEMRRRQGELCSICGYWMHEEEVSFEHSDGRGFNGSHRDDRIEKDGMPYNSAAHLICNCRKGSIRLENFNPGKETTVH